MKLLYLHKKIKQETAYSLALQATDGMFCVHMSKHSPMVSGEGGTLQSKLPAGAVPASCCPLN